jgi:glycosyltransferase involved in cell wall biosynthesis
MFKIGFDAKRAFLNRSGLGNYSRFVLNSLLKYHPDFKYFLFTPKVNFDIYKPSLSAEVISPRTLTEKMFKSYWRSFLSVRDISRLDINLYHGLSGELPFGIDKTKTKAIVTIHDLIFLRYPEWYKPIDRKIYYKKALNACKNADRIIAISEQTKNDIVEFLGIFENKISVVYQGCSKRFMELVTEDEKKRIQNKFKLPPEYILYVGTVEERKNLLSVIRALHEGAIDIPLVVVGKLTNYAEKIKEYIKRNKVKHVYFLKDVLDEDLPALYQKSAMFVYPSIYEGFGIPILEALYSKTPVITSKEGCFKEAGGPGSLYIEPKNPEEIGNAMKKILEDKAYREKIIDEGYLYAQNFNHKELTSELTDIYKSV